MQTTAKEKASLSISQQAAVSKERYRIRCFRWNLCWTAVRSIVPTCLMMFVQWPVCRGSVSRCAALASMETIRVPNNPDSKVALPMISSQNVMLHEVLDLPRNKNRGWILKTRAGPQPQLQSQNCQDTKSRHLCKLEPRESGCYSRWTYHCTYTNASSNSPAWWGEGSIISAISLTPQAMSLD